MSTRKEKNTVECHGKFVTLPLDYLLKSQIQSASFGAMLSPISLSMSLVTALAQRSSSFSHLSSPEKKLGSFTPALVRKVNAR